MAKKVRWERLISPQSNVKPTLLFGAGPAADPRVTQRLGLCCKVGSISLYTGDLPFWPLVADIATKTSWVQKFVPPFDRRRKLMTEVAWKKRMEWGVQFLLLAWRAVVFGWDGREAVFIVSVGPRPLVRTLGFSASIYSRWNQPFWQRTV